MEEWRTIDGTSGMIEVSNLGRVRSWLRGTPRILKATPDYKGYLRLHITINRKRIAMKVHREVAKAFIPNRDNLPQVNHIDGDKTNNAVGNLEWCSNRDNAAHAIRTGLWDTVIDGSRRENASRMKPIIGVHNGVEMRFDSVSDAERYIGSRHISDVLKGKRAHAGGWSFRYVEGR